MQKGNMTLLFLDKKTTVIIDSFYMGHDCRYTNPKVNEEYWVVGKRERNTDSKRSLMIGLLGGAGQCFGFRSLNSKSPPVLLVKPSDLLPFNITVKYKYGVLNDFYWRKV